MQINVEMIGRAVRPQFCWDHRNVNSSWFAMHFKSDRTANKHMGLIVFFALSKENGLPREAVISFLKIKKSIAKTVEEKLAVLQATKERTEEFELFRRKLGLARNLLKTIS